jgi:hypothetical protein
LGIEKTYNAISEIYYWKNVYSDVSNQSPHDTMVQLLV